MSVVGRRVTGLPPLRLPGPVVEIGPAGDPAERIPLDRLYVLSDGVRAQLRADGYGEGLFLHNGELDTGVHTAFALPRIRPPMLPDTACLPRLRNRNVVLARRRWRLAPGPLSGARDQQAGDGLTLRRALRSTWRSASPSPACWSRAPLSGPGTSRQRRRASTTLRLRNRGR